MTYLPDDSYIVCFQFSWQVHTMSQSRRKGVREAPTTALTPPHPHTHPKLINSGIIFGKIFLRIPFHRAETLQSSICEFENIANIEGGRERRFDFLKCDSGGHIHRRVHFVGKVGVQLRFFDLLQPGREGREWRIFSPLDQRTSVLLLPRRVLHPARRRLDRQSVRLRLNLLGQRESPPLAIRTFLLGSFFLICRCSS